MDRVIYHFTLFRLGNNTSRQAISRVRDVEYTHPAAGEIQSTVAD